VALEAVPFGLAIGLAVGLLGGGGSVLAVPVLVYVLGQGVQEATTTSLLVVAAGALAGGLAHHREGRVCWLHAVTFTAGAVPGVFAGTAAADAVSAGVLIGGFAVVMLFAAAATWRNSNGQREPGADRKQATCPPIRIARDAVAGLAIGFATGFFGVGGGFLIVPTLAVALALSMRLAVGTSLAIIAATSTIALIVHLLAGRSMDPGITAAMTAACAAGALGGAALAGRISQRHLGHSFAVLLTAVAAYLLVSAAFLGGPPGAS
jgi:uncharacterized protein